jgi:hypothetical protein
MSSQQEEPEPEPVATTVEGGELQATAAPRPIPQTASAAYVRPKGSTHSSESSHSSSPRVSEVGSSSNASAAHPLDSRPGAPPAPSGQDVIIARPASSAAVEAGPSSSATNAEGSSPSRVVSRQSTPPPLEAPIPLLGTSGLLLGTATGQAGMLSIAPPRRNFAATPSMPSPLARPSIVPTRTSDDEDDDVLDADVETATLEPVPDAVPPSDGRGMRVVAKRRTSSAAALLGTSPRATSPTALVQQLFPGGRPPPAPSSSSAISTTSSDAGSPTAADLNALGLVTAAQTIRKERQLSDGSAGRSDHSSPSTSWVLLLLSRSV